MFRFSLYFVIFLAFSKQLEIKAASRFDNDKHNDPSFREKREILVLPKIPNSIKETVLTMAIPLFGNSIENIERLLNAPGGTSNKRIQSNNRKDTNKTVKACVINIKTLPINYPLIIEPSENDKYKFKYPIDETGNIYFLSGQSVLLSCVQESNHFIKIPSRYHSMFTCVNDTLFYRENNERKIYDFRELYCKRIPEYEIKDHLNRACNKVMKVSFEVKPRKYLDVMDIYYDRPNLRPIYVKSSVPRIIAGGQGKSAERDYAETRSALKLAYEEQENVQGSFRNQLKCTNSKSHRCTYFNDDVHKKFVPGQLAHPSFFVYKVAGITTYDYLNTGPQWLRINRGNWIQIQQHIVELAKELKVDLDVYTGTFGNLKLIDNADNYFKKEIYLNLDKSIRVQKPVSISEYFWTIAYDRKMERGVVYVTVNNPYIVYGSDHHLCRNARFKEDNVRMPRKWQPDNFAKGYSYMCDVADFLQTTGIKIEELKNADSLLHIKGDYWDKDYNHTFMISMALSKIPVEDPYLDDAPISLGFEDSDKNCKIPLNSLTELSPLILKSNISNSFADVYYPNAQGNIIIENYNHGQFLCIGTNNIFDYWKHFGRYGYRDFVCVDGHYLVEGVIFHSIRELSCLKPPPIAEINQYKDSLSNQANYWIALSADKKTNIIHVYYNKEISSPSYVRYPIRCPVAGHQWSGKPLDLPYREYCCMGHPFGIAPFYKSFNYLQHLLHLVKCYYTTCAHYFNLSRTTGYYFVPTSLAPALHFSYTAMANATFNYINTRPMWKIIKEGNWARTEKFILEMAKYFDIDEFMVQAGASGQLKLLDTDTHQLVKFSLGFLDQNIPISEHFWKFVCSKERPIAKGVFFITVNNPFLNLTNYKPLCQRIDIKSIRMPKWDDSASMGYSYMCSASDVFHKDDKNGWKNIKFELLSIPINSDCQFHVNDLSDTSPLVLKNWTYKNFANFYYPDNRGIITIKKNEEAFFFCTDHLFHNNLRYMDAYRKLICKNSQLRTQLTNLEKFKPEQLDCRDTPSFDVYKIDEWMNPEMFEQYWIAIAHGDNKVNLINVIYNGKISATVYVEYQMHKSIAGRQQNIILEQNFHPYECCYGDSLKVSMLELYDLNAQKKFFDWFSENCYDSENCKNYLKIDGWLPNYFVPAQLAPASHFSFRASANATFIYWNTRPMWQSIYTNDWVRTNEFIYEMVKDLDEDEIIIYSGASDQLKLPTRTLMKKLYDDNIFLSTYYGEVGYSTPVPLYFWKLVYNKNNREGAVFVTVNNPVLENTKDVQICQPETSTTVRKPHWWGRGISGYSYMCHPAEVLKKDNSHIKIYDRKIGSLIMRDPIVRFLTLPSDDTCWFSVNNLPANSPLILMYWHYGNFSQFYYPNHRGTIVVPNNESVVLMCPGDANHLKILDKDLTDIQGYHKFICNQGLLELDNTGYNVNDFTCKENFSFNIKNNFADYVRDYFQKYWITFIYRDQYINVIRVFYLQISASTAYVQYPMRRSAAGYESSTRTLIQDFDDTDCCPGLEIKIQELYNIDHQESHFNSLIGCLECRLEFQFNPETGHYFVPAQLAHPSHFPYKSVASATYSYMNTRPMWKNIRDGNWARTEEFIYKMVANMDESEIMVYGGASKDRMLESIKVTLGHNGHAVPIPEFFWKVVYNSRTNEGVALITVNNPNLYIPDYTPICTNIVDTSVKRPDWFKNVKLGLSYMCKAGEFIKNANEADYLTIWNENWEKSPYDPKMKLLKIPSDQDWVPVK